MNPAKLQSIIKILKDSWELKLNKMKKFIIKWLGLDAEMDILRRKIEELEGRETRIFKILETNGKTVLEHKQAIEKILSMIHLGVDVHDPRYQPSWCVVCLKGKENDRDIVNFFEVRFKDYKHLKEMLRRFDIFEKKAIDLPPHIRKDFFI
jgi:hypothetical protein